MDNKTGSVNRNGLYKALALTAMAQNGKTINDKLLDSYAGQGNILSYINVVSTTMARQRCQVIFEIAVKLFKVLSSHRSSINTF